MIEIKIIEYLEPKCFIFSNSEQYKLTKINKANPTFLSDEKNQTICFYI